MNRVPGLARVAAAFVLVACLFLALVFAASSSDARASAPGEPVEFNFNYASLYTQTNIVGAIDDFVVRPSDGNGEVQIRGVYDDSDGNFTVPATGWSFPEFEIRYMIGGSFDASLEMVGDAQGSFDAATGELVFEPKLALTFGLDSATELPASAPDEPLECLLAPLDASFSTENGWPHPGSRFADPSGNGSIAGAWRSKPPVQPIQGGEICSVISHFVESVGGLWLAQSDTEITSLPPATAEKPSSVPFVLPPEPTEPTEPSVVPIEPVEPVGPVGPLGVASPSAEITRVSMPRGSMKARSGSLARVPIRITNAGTAPTSLRVVVKSNRKRVKAPKRISVKVPAARTVTRRVPVRIKKRAKGKAKITVKVAGHSGQMRIRVK